MPTSTQPRATTLMILAGLTAMTVLDATAKAAEDARLGGETVSSSDLLAAALRGCPGVAAAMAAKDGRSSDTPELIAMTQSLVEEVARGCHDATELVREMAKLKTGSGHP